MGYVIVQEPAEDGVDCSSGSIVFCMGVWTVLAGHKQGPFGLFTCVESTDSGLGL